MGSPTLEAMLPSIYAAIDEHRFHDVPEFYAPEITAETPGGALSGREQLLEQLTRNHEGIPALQHLVSGMLLEERDGLADVRANLIAIFADARGEVQFELGSIWRGSARLDQDGWRLTRFAITPVWQRGTRPAR